MRIASERRVLRESPKQVSKFIAYHGSTDGEKSLQAVKYNGSKGKATLLYASRMTVTTLMHISILDTSSHRLTIHKLDQAMIIPFPQTGGLNINRLDERNCLARATLELLAEEQELNLVVDRQDTSTGNTTEDVSTSTLEEGLDTLLGGDLAGGIEGRAVLDGLWMVNQPMPSECRVYKKILTSPEVIIIRRRIVSRG